MLNSKEKSDIQENLVALYLRLNGYFTSGFVIHSTSNDLKGEVDIIGVRFPMHKQDETGHNSSDYLEVPNNIDVIIGEVKSRSKPLQFNKSLRGSEGLQSWRKVLNWTGLMFPEQIDDVAAELVKIIQPRENSKLPNLKSVNLKGTEFGVVSFRPIIFSPERLNYHNADKFIGWREINGFIHNCLCPSSSNIQCGTKYDYTAWGAGLKEIVNIYKNIGQSGKFREINELYLEILKAR